MTVPLLDRRFILVTGKGGVGKSTVTAMLAHLSASAGRRTLVCELNTREQVATLFGHAPVGGEITEVAPNLHVVNIEPARAMEEYGLQKLRFRAVYKLVFDNPVVQSLVRFIPGVNDLLMMGKAFNHERELDSEDEPVWDCVIIDAPATGHGVSFFRLPQIIRDAVPAGNLHKEAADMWGLLTDPARTAIHLVALPEALPVRETIELHAQLTGELGLPLGHLFVNRVPPDRMDAKTRADFEALEPPLAAPLDRLWATSQVRAGRVEQAARHQAELATLGLPVIALDQLYTETFGRPEIEALAAQYQAAWDDA